MRSPYGRDRLCRGGQFAVSGSGSAADPGQGKPYAATEFGCCTYLGAAVVAGRPEPVTCDEHGRPPNSSPE